MKLPVDYDKEFGEMIVKLMSLNTGVGIDFFGGMLSLYPLENGTYSVVSKDHKDNLLYQRDGFTLTKAIDMFLKIRAQRELGFDIEKLLIANSNNKP